MPTGTQMAYVAGTDVRPSDLPRAARAYVRVHQPVRRPTGLDWAALAPSCKTCSTKSSDVGGDGLCPRCRAPKPAAATPAKKPRAPKAARVPKVRKPRTPAAPKGPTPLARARAATRAAVVAEYTDGGVLISDLAAKYNVSTSLVRKALDAAGIERRDERSLRSGGRPRDYDETTMDDVCRLYTVEELSQPAIAERLDLPYKTVVTIMHRRGIEPRKGPGGGGDHAADLKQRIAALGVTPSEVKSWAVREGVLLGMQPGIPPARVVDAYAAAHVESKESIHA